MKRGDLGETALPDVRGESRFIIFLTVYLVP